MIEIDGWTIRVHADKVTGMENVPNGQSFSIAGGILCVDIHKNEIHRGWSGDCAADRFIPMTVIMAAFTAKT